MVMSCTIFHYLMLPEGVKECLSWFSSYSSNQKLQSLMMQTEQKFHLLISEPLIFFKQSVAVGWDPFNIKAINLS